MSQIELNDLHIQMLRKLRKDGPLFLSKNFNFSNADIDKAYQYLHQNSLIETGKEGDFITKRGKDALEAIKK